MYYQSAVRVSLAFFALCWGLSAVHAQTALNADRQEPAGLEEIVITAEKRAESIRDVPASVLAFTAETLDATNVRDFDDLVTIAPSVTITKTTQPANNSISIRRVGTYWSRIPTPPRTPTVVADIHQE